MLRLCRTVLARSAFPFQPSCHCFLLFLSTTLSLWPHMAARFRFHLLLGFGFRVLRKSLLWLTWWTIGTLLLTNLLTIYIHFSHTPAGVITTSLTILYLPSNPLQLHSVACASFQIITKLLTLICRQFLWPYSCWNVLPLPKHSLISSTCINRLLEHDQSLKLGLLWILDLQSLTVSDLLSFIKLQNPHLHLRTYPKVC